MGFDTRSSGSVESSSTRTDAEGAIGAAYTLDTAGATDVWLVGVILDVNATITIDGLVADTPQRVVIRGAQDATGGNTLSIADDAGTVAVAIADGADDVFQILYDWDGSAGVAYVAGGSPAAGGATTEDHEIGDAGFELGDGWTTPFPPVAIRRTGDQLFISGALRHTVTDMGNSELFALPDAWVSNDLTIGYAYAPVALLSSLGVYKDASEGQVYQYAGSGDPGDHSGIWANGLSQGNGTSAALIAAIAPGDLIEFLFSRSITIIDLSV